MFLLEPQKEPKRVPLLPIAREARLRGAWVRALRERFASAPLRTQERTDWPLPAANTLQWNCSQFLFLVAAFWQFVGGGVLGTAFRPRRGQCGGRRKSVKKNAALLHFLAFSLTDPRFGVLRGEQPLGRGLRVAHARARFTGWRRLLCAAKRLPRNSETFFASFFGHKKGRPNGRIPLNSSAPPQGGGKRERKKEEHCYVKITSYSPHGWPGQPVF